MSANEKQSRRPLFFLIAVAIIWPPVYSTFIGPYIAPVTPPHNASTGELQRLLDARRYTLKIPPECDGWYLSLESIVDGVPKRSGGSTVVGNTEVILLVRQLPDTPKIEFCWFTENQLSRGYIDDPLDGATLTSDRGDGPVKSGDWLMRGGRESIQSNTEADFEVRVFLRPPNLEEAT